MKDFFVRVTKLKLSNLRNGEGICGKREESVNDEDNVNFENLKRLGTDITYSMYTEGDSNAK